MMKNIYTSLFLLLSTLMGHAQWNSNTSVNLEIAGVNLADQQTVSTSDGKTWIAFYSLIGGSHFMRAQLLDADGNKLELWEPADETVL